MTARNPKAADVTINGVDYWLADGEENAYDQGFVRQVAQAQEFLENEGQLMSRPDLRAVFQTSWSAGARWARPLISRSTIDSYYLSDRIDVTSEPGNLFPMNTVTADDQSGTIYGFGVQVGTEIYFVEPFTGASNVGLRKWTGSAWSTLTNDFGFDTWTYAMCFDPSGDSGAGTMLRYDVAGDIHELDIDDGTAGALILSLTNSSPTPGSNMFFHNGRLMVWDGSTLEEVTNLYATEAQTTVFNPGGGPDLLDNMATATNRILIDAQCRLAMSTAEGVYIVKNEEQEGVPMARVFRVDRDNAGNDIGKPVTSLPPGVLALNIYYHLGSLLILATSEASAAIVNNSDAKHIKTTLYHFTNNQLGVVGSFNTLRAADESVVQICGANEERVYLAGEKRLWVYDAVAGGLHPMVDLSDTEYRIVQVFETTDSAGNPVLLGLKDFGQLVWIETQDGTDTGETRYLESNYFEFNLPNETKSIVDVTLMTDGIQANETWTLKVKADDAASFTTVASWTSTDANTTRKNLATPLSGHRYVYRLEYSTTGAIAAPSRVKGLVFRAVSGEFVRVWQLLLDVTDSSHGGQRRRPDSLFTGLQTLGATQAPVAFVDNYAQSQLSTSVRVQAANLIKSSPNEGVARVVLIEHPTT
jgi:hypothetical protein